MADRQSMFPPATRCYTRFFLAAGLLSLIVAVPISILIRHQDEEPARTVEKRPDLEVADSNSLPRPLRVISLEVSLGQLGEGVLRPGDRVDIIGLTTANGQQIAKTLLRHVPVRGVDEVMNGQAVVPNTRTVSLEVEPRQVGVLGKQVYERLSLSMSMLPEIDPALADEDCVLPYLFDD